MSNYIDNIVKNAVTYDLVSKPLANDMANEFSIQSTYAVGDYVMYDYKLYKCISAVTTAGNWDSAKWQECKIGDEINGGVKYTAQTLTSEQKAQTRANIGAISQEEATPDAIRYSAQSLTEAQKNQVRLNVGTVSFTSIADEFSTSNAYAVGDLVVYDSKLYKFKTAHSAGAWNVAQVDAVSVKEEISSLSNDLSDKTNYYTEEVIAASASPEGWRLDGTGKCVEDSNYKLVKYEVTAGDKLHLVLSKDVTSTEAEGVYQWQNAASVPSQLPNSGLIGTPVTTAIDGYVTVPTGTTYLIVSQFKTNTTNSVKKVTGTESLKSKVSDLEEEVSQIEPGLSSEAKDALLACFRNVSWCNEQGQTYYNTLYTALYGVQPDVPIDYVKYDWIKVNTVDSLGGNQYGLLRTNQILLPITGDKNNYKYDVIVGNYKPFSSGLCVFGGRDIDGSTDSTAFYINSTGDPQKLAFQGHGEEYVSGALQSTLPNPCHFVFNPAVNPTIMIADGNEITRAWFNQSQETNAQLALFGNPAPGANNAIYASQNIPQKIGRLKVYNTSNELICDCIPCSNPQGKYGVYEKITGTFLTSTATNTYTCGNWS